MDKEFAMKLKMLACLAFVPEVDVIYSFDQIMAEYSESAMGRSKYFEVTYIGKKLPNNTRRTPLFPIRIWNMYMRVINRKARTNKGAFRTGIGHALPSLGKLVKRISYRLDYRLDCPKFSAIG